MPETCCALSKRQVINLRSCCIFLVDSVESMMMHGLANPKLIDFGHWGALDNESPSLVPGENVWDLLSMRSQLLPSISCCQSAQYIPIFTLVLVPQSYSRSNQ